MSFKSAAYAALASFLICGLILATRRWHGRFTVDGSHGVQKFHTNPTPRIGGLGLMVGILVGWWVQKESPTLILADHVLGLTLFASLPAFVFGLAEDVTKRVSVRNRLLATMASGALAFALTGYGINRLDVWGLDTLLAWTPFCLIFTAFAAAGVANAYNIIDGFNGLTSAAMIVALAAMGTIAYRVGDSELIHFSLIYSGAILGFMAWNYPLGRLFLGDGGAYAMGFLIAWMAVMLPARNPDVSPWASLMACGYPVMETIYSMLRRKLQRHNPGEPDALHLHSLVKRVLISRRYKHFAGWIRNSLVMPTLLPFVIGIALVGTLFYWDTDILILSFVLLLSFYVLTHSRFIRSLGSQGKVH